MQTNFITSTELLPIQDLLLELEQSLITGYSHPGNPETECLIDTDFWEIGTSGTRYSADEVRQILRTRKETCADSGLSIQEPYCQLLTENLYLLSYSLEHNSKRSKRASIWRYHAGWWKIAYHQGTPVP